FARLTSLIPSLAGPRPHRTGASRQAGLLTYDQLRRRHRASAVSLLYLYKEIDMVKTEQPVRQRKPRKPDMLDQYIPKYGMPEILTLSPLPMAWLRWGKAECYSGRVEAEGDRA